MRRVLVLSRGKMRSEWVVLGCGGKGVYGDSWLGSEKWLLRDWGIDQK